MLIIVAAQQNKSGAVEGGLRLEARERHITGHNEFCIHLEEKSEHCEAPKKRHSIRNV